jgi:hypothetical protein
MVDNFVKIDDCLLVRCPLSLAQIWRVVVYYVADGFPCSFLLFVDKVGVASDESLDRFFLSA